jgi:hypothetical protein
LTNFSNGKQTHESLESDFLKSEFRETNMALKDNCTTLPNKLLKEQVVLSCPPGETVQTAAFKI